MSGEQPSYRQKQEKAAQERKQAQEEADRHEIVAALHGIVDTHKADSEADRRTQRLHRRIEEIGLKQGGHHRHIHVILRERCLGVESSFTVPELLLLIVTTQNFTQGRDAR